MSLLAAAGLSGGAVALLITASLVAGLARGFSGFGGALIFMPLASALTGPKVASVALLLADMVMTAPMLRPAWVKAKRHEVFTMLAGALIGVPVGTLALTHMPTGALRWGICLVVFAMLAMLASGWRYKGAPRTPLTVAVGGLAGLFGGAAQLSGPPVVAYWLGGALPAAAMRASIVLYFGLSSLISLASYHAGGLLVSKAFAVALIAGPAYGIGIFAGTRLFGLASETTFRRICLGLIAIAAVVGLPLF